MMQEMKGTPHNRFEPPAWLRISLAYGVTIGGIFLLILLATLFLKFWLIGLVSIIVVIPLFPAMQAILLKKTPADPYVFLKVYAAEFASLALQLGLLLVSAPFIAIAVAGVLACMLLAAAVISWVIVGLQQLGLDMGSKMSSADIAIFFRVTLGLVAAVWLFYLFIRLVKKYGDSFFSLWARQFVKIREFFRYDLLR